MKMIKRNKQTPKNNENVVLRKFNNYTIFIKKIDSVNYYYLI